MRPLPRVLPAFAALVALALLSGCAYYVPPGPKADLAVFAPADSSIETNLARRPASPFPATLAVVRAQGRGYTNYYLGRCGFPQTNGRYTLVTVREVEEQAQLDRLAALPQVAGVTGISRLLLSDKLDTDRDLRAAAARLQADLILLYTFDTAFFDQDAAKPLSVVSLGLSPTRKVTATTTVSALLIDTRTGYIHATFEATETASHRGTSWGNADNADAARRDTERAAFAKLVDDFAKAWPRISAPRTALTAPQPGVAPAPAPAPAPKTEAPAS